jgi:hypothetical protein
VLLAENFSSPRFGALKLFIALVNVDKRLKENHCRTVSFVEKFARSTGQDSVLVNARWSGIAGKKSITTPGVKHEIITHLLFG